jgi:hypothetical protein
MEPGRESSMMKKRATAIGAAGALIFGGAVFLAWHNEHIGRSLWSVFQPILLPINFIIQSIIGTSDAYLYVYVALDVLFMAVVGFLFGYYLYRACRFRRHRKNDETA